MGGDMVRTKFRKSGVVMGFVVGERLSLSLPRCAAEVIIWPHNDVHSRLESHIPEGGDVEQGGRVRLATLVDEVREMYGADKVLLLDAGDAIHGMNIDNLFGGLPSIEV